MRELELRAMMGVWVKDRHDARKLLKEEDGLLIGTITLVLPFKMTTGCIVLCGRARDSGGGRTLPPAIALIRAMMVRLLPRSEPYQELTLSRTALASKTASATFQVDFSTEAVGASRHLHALTPTRAISACGIWTLSAPGQ